MNEQQIERLMENGKYRELEFIGNCHNCGCPVVSLIVKDKENKTQLFGDIVYFPEERTNSNAFYFKCQKCFQANRNLTNFQECEVYSRVVGYLRPVKNWNDAKQQEFENRTTFNLKETVKNDVL